MKKYNVSLYEFVYDADTKQHIKNSYTVMVEAESTEDAKSNVRKTATENIESVEEYVKPKKKK